MHKKVTDSIPVPATGKGANNHAVKKEVEKTLPKTATKKRSKCLFEQFKNYSNNMFTFFHFKPAKLFTADLDLSKNWYVEYYYLKPGTTGEFKRFRITLDMNRINTVADRLLYGKEVERFMNIALKDGFNPFTEMKITSKASFPVISDQLKTIIKEETRKASKYKIDSYNENFNRFMKFIEEEEMNDISMHEFDQHHADAFRDYLDDELDLSVKTINGALSYLTKFFKCGIRKRWCTTNPFAEIERMHKNQKEVKDERFEPLTEEEIDRIISHLNATGEVNYKVFLGFIYYAFARPAEIARLKIADIDLKRDLIRFSKGGTKNKEGGFVQIVPPLKKLIQQLKPESYPANFLIFGADDFKPGMKKLPRNRSTQKWNDIVKSKDGLQIKKDQYGLKHTGNIEYLLRNKGNVDLKWQQMQNRHSSATMTQKYCDKLGAYFIEVGALNFKVFE